jgi:hypothetical protein
MPQNYLQLVQTACDELGLVRPSSVANSTDLQIRQLSALMKRDLREVQQNYNFTRLQTEYDLHVSQPFNAIGDVVVNSTVITNIVIVSGLNDFNTDFSPDFGGNLQSVTDPPLWVINGQGIPVATRLVSIDSLTQLTMSQPSTITQTGVSLVIAQDTYPEPIDFDRFIPQTWWDRTNRWALLGPDSPQVDQWHRSGVVTIGPRRHFRQIGYNGLNPTLSPINCYRLWPPPGATDTPINITFEYISKYVVLSASGTPQITFQADTDIPILDENIFILGAKWRMWAIKGFDYAAMQQEYVDYCDRKFANDGGAKTLNMSRSRGTFLINSGNVQDSNYPSGSSGV